MPGLSPTGQWASNSAKFPLFTTVERELLPKRFYINNDEFTREWEFDLRAISTQEVGGSSTAASSSIMPIVCQ